MLNPKVIDRIVVSTEPMTEKNPFTAHDHAMYSSACSLSSPTRLEAERHEHAEAEPERGEDDQRARATRTARLWSSSESVRLSRPIS